MVNNTLIFLRHAETIPDKHIRISEWDITEQGLLETKKLLKDKQFRGLHAIIASKEKKAIQTAQVFSDYFSIPIIEYSELNELNRDRSDWIETKEDYDNIAKKCLKERDNSFNNWETADDALSRFSYRISEINRAFSDCKILIVSHGLIINLLFAQMLNDFSEVYERWKSSTFSDFGVITNDRIIVDINKRK